MGGWPTYKINQYTLDGKFIQEWDNAAEILRTLGFYKSAILKVCKGTQHQSYGFCWSFEKLSPEQVKSKVRVSDLTSKKRIIIGKKRRKS